MPTASSAGRKGRRSEARNRAFHRMVLDGVTVEHRMHDGHIRGAQVRVVDFDDAEGNDWLAANKVVVVENRHERRPDLALFVNGLPLGLIELKNPAAEDATVSSAWQQLQYKAELPTLFTMNAALIVSDGIEARIGTFTAGREWFKPWRTVSGVGPCRSAPASSRRHPARLSYRRPGLGATTDPATWAWRVDVRASAATLSRQE